MTTVTDTCWADPLTRAERAELGRRLARACKRSYDAALPHIAKGCTESEAWKTTLGYALVEVSAECSNLHLDVTEHAAVPARVSPYPDREPTGN